MKHGSDENNSFFESFYQVEMIDDKAPPPIFLQRVLE